MLAVRLACEAAAQLTPQSQRAQLARRCHRTYRVPAPGAREHVVGSRVSTPRRRVVLARARTHHGRPERLADSTVNARVSEVLEIRPKYRLCTNTTTQQQRGTPGQGGIQRCRTPVMVRRSSQAQRQHTRDSVPSRPPGPRAPQQRRRQCQHQRPLQRQRQRQALLRRRPGHSPRSVPPADHAAPAAATAAAPQRRGWRVVSELA